MEWGVGGGQYGDRDARELSNDSGLYFTALKLFAHLNVCERGW